MHIFIHDFCHMCLDSRDSVVTTGPVVKSRCHNTLVDKLSLARTFDSERSGSRPDVGAALTDGRPPCLRIYSPVVNYI